MENQRKRNIDNLYFIHKVIITFIKKIMIHTLGSSGDSAGNESQFGLKIIEHRDNVNGRVIKSTTIKVIDTVRGKTVILLLQGDIYNYQFFGSNRADFYLETFEAAVRQEYTGESTATLVRIEGDMLDLIDEKLRYYNQWDKSSGVSSVMAPSSVYNGPQGIYSSKTYNF